MGTEVERGGTRQRPSLKSFWPPPHPPFHPPFRTPLVVASSDPRPRGRRGEGVPRAFDVGGPMTGAESPCGNDARFLAPRRLPDTTGDPCSSQPTLSLRLFLSLFLKRPFHLIPPANSPSPSSITRYFRPPMTSGIENGYH